MAKWHVQGKSVLVQPGDNLWRIAVEFLGNGDESYGQKSYHLAKINKIPAPNYYIYPGDIIELYESGSSSGSTGSTSRDPTKPYSVRLGPISTETDKLFATWECDNWKKSESYRVLWRYSTGDGVWFVGRDTTIKIEADDKTIGHCDTFPIPENSLAVKFKVIPVPQKTGSGDNAKEKFKANWSDEETYTNETPLSAPSAPSIEINEYLELITRLDNISIQNATHIEFQVAQERSTSPYATQKNPIENDSASAVFRVSAGTNYKVRARAWNNKTKLTSDWSPYSAFEGTKPEPPRGITDIRAKSKTSVYLEWEPAIESAAKTYDIEYAEKKEYFDGSDQTTTKSGIEFTHYEIGGLTTGTRYFFRVRAVNDDGESSWTEPKSVVIGTKPSAPTTWSSTTTVIVGEPLTLFWVHNSEDGSRQVFAELELYIDEQKVPVPTIKFPEVEDEDEEEKISSYDIDTTNFPEGTKIQWRVATAGITQALGDWSVQRTVDVYAMPTIALKVTDLNSNPVEDLTSFPFYVYGLTGPNTQKPIGYHLSIISNDIYETVDNIGNPKIVNVGDQVYSKYFDIQDALLVEMSANNVDLENDIEYTIICTASMDSGLTAEATQTFTVHWQDTLFVPNASVGLNSENLTVTIQPYCEDSRTVYYRVDFVDDEYIKTDESLGWMTGPVVKDAKTTTDETVYTGYNDEGEEVYYCIVTESTLVTDVYIGVYRREFDGSFTEIAKSIDGAHMTTVVDPHPALDYARYRIVATSKNTGSVSFADLPGHPVNGKAAVIQWDEEWTSFDVTEDAEMVRPPWTGSMLMLPYNIDVSDNNRSDVALVEYIGRTHPVSYYGTQLGQNSSWNMEIPKSDKETLYALRRLSRWMGDVYVREPSGSGYWANITISFNQKHKAVTIPVTLDIKRVEGGA